MTLLTRKLSKRAKMRAKHELLLKNFEHQKVDHYEELNVNGQWMVKMFNGHSKVWQVHLFGNEEFENYRSKNAKKRIHRSGRPRPWNMAKGGEVTTYYIPVDMGVDNTSQVAT